jgi:hypothetical protein
MDEYTVRQSVSDIQVDTDCDQDGMYGIFLDPDLMGIRELVSCFPNTIMGKLVINFLGYCPPD